MPRRRAVVWIAGTASLVAVAIAVTLIGLSNRGGPSTGIGPPSPGATGSASALPPGATASASPGNSASPGGSASPSPPALGTVAPKPAGAFDVTAYGAVGDGRSDSAPGIQRAIDAAQAAGGGVVYVPAGRYLDAGGVLIEVASGPAVTVAGAGRDASFLIQGVRHKALLSVKADHSVVQDLTVDSQTNDGNSAFETTANNVTLRRCRALGGTSVWAVRFAGGRGVARPTSPSYATGNVVDDLILHDFAPGQNDGLDFSYQQNGSISNVQHIGSRVGLFIDSHVTVTNYTFSPEPSLASGTFGYFITAPSDHVTIAGFISSGEGGHIGVSPPGGPRRISSDITITGERMTGAGQYRLFIGDVTGLMVAGCTLGEIDIAPNIEAQGVIETTTDTAVVRHPARQGSDQVAVQQ